VVAKLKILSKTLLKGNLLLEFINGLKPENSYLFLLLLE